MATSSSSSADPDLYDDSGFTTFASNIGSLSDDDLRKLYRASQRAPGPHTYRDFPFAQRNIRNWDDFNVMLQDVADKKKDIKLQNRALRRSGASELIRNPYQNYDAQGIASLATIMHGKKSVAFKPEWQAEESAKEWLKYQKANAKTKEERDVWDKWGIAQSDLDRDPDTPDNVILFSNRDAGKIHAIDGHYLKQPRYVMKNIYKDYDTAEKRRAIDPDELKVIKAWYRKYPTIAQQKANPYKDFVPEKNAFTIVKENIKELLDQHNMIPYSSEYDIGNIHITRFMSIWQKVASMINIKLMSGFFRVPENYFKGEDVRGLKDKENQQRYRNWLSNNINKITSADNLRAMYDLIRTIVANINAGIPKELQLNITHSPVTGNFQILDGKVTEQKKKADEKRKAKTDHLTKSKTAGRILPMPTRYSEAHTARVARATEDETVKKDRLQEMRDRIKAEMEARALTEASSSSAPPPDDE
jgi:hypothetical protein